MVTAIVLMEAERSAIARLGPALADVPGVAEAYSVTGEFATTTADESRQSPIGPGPVGGGVH